VEDVECFHCDVPLLFSTVIHLAQSNHNGENILGFFSVLELPLEALLNSFMLNNFYPSFWLGLMSDPLLTVGNKTHLLFIYYLFYFAVVFLPSVQTQDSSEYCGLGNV